MSSGKKGKKIKGKTLALPDFLADTPGGITLKSSNWADDVEDDHDRYSSRSNKEPVILPTAPRAVRGSGVDEENIPTNPPYVANIFNLPYDVDEVDLTEFFADLKVSTMRLPKDSNKLKGFGYVEFEDRQSLIDALSMTNMSIKNRRVRIEVSNNSNDDRRGGRMGRENRRDNYDDPERTSGDWRSGPRDEIPTSDSDRYRSRGGFDSRDRRDDRDGNEDSKPGAWRESSDKGGTAFRDRGGFRDDDRDKDWTRYGDRDGDRDRSSNFGPRRNYGDSDWDRNSSSRRQGRLSQNPDTKRVEESRTRPKLQLQPRTKPVESVIVEEQSPERASSSAPAPAPAPTLMPAVNIFGAAKPVDTAAKEREIEERLAKFNAEAKSKEDGDSERRNTKESLWGRRNGEGRDDKERGRQGWRSNDDKDRKQTEKSVPRNQPTSTRPAAGQRGDSKGPVATRGVPPTSTSRGYQKTSDSRGPPEKEKKADKDDEVSRMPKAKDEQAPNFVASNKYSMLPDDVDPDIIDVDD